MRTVPERAIFFGIRALSGTVEVVPPTVATLPRQELDGPNPSRRDAMQVGALGSGRTWADWYGARVQAYVGPNWSHSHIGLEA